MRLALLFCFVPLLAHAQEREPIRTPYATYDLAEVGLFSADQASAARAGSFTPTDEPLAFHLNPALLAGVGRTGGVMVSGDLSTRYVLGDIPGTTHAGAAFGTTVRAAGAPLALGVGVSRTSLDYGPISRTTSELPPDNPGVEEIEATESDWSAAVGVGWRGVVDVDLGFGLHRRDRVVDEITGEGITADLGALVSVPVFGRTARGPLSPALDVSVGYAQRHIGLGNELVVDGQSRDVKPLRDGVLGYGVRAGLDAAVGSGYVRAVELDGRVEASASLAEEALIGGMRADNALFGTGGASTCEPSGDGRDGRCGFGVVTGRRALRLTLFDALSYTRGRAKAGDNNARAAWGASLDAGAALRLVGLLTDAPALAETGERLTLRVSYAEDSVNGFEFNFVGLTAGWKL